MASADLTAAAREVKFRDPGLARKLASQIARLTSEMGRSPVSVMHVCGSHEQAIAKWGLRASFPRELNVIMGPGRAWSSRPTATWSRCRAPSSP
jgi:hydrogenase expression/formation protein HypD